MVARTGKNQTHLAQTTFNWAYRIILVKIIFFHLEWLQFINFLAKKWFQTSKVSLWTTNKYRECRIPSCDLLTRQVIVLFTCFCFEIILSFNCEVWFQVNVRTYGYAYLLIFIHLLVTEPYHYLYDVNVSHLEQTDATRFWHLYVLLLFLGNNIKHKINVLPLLWLQRTARDPWSRRECSGVVAVLRQSYRFRDHEDRCGEQCLLLKGKNINCSRICFYRPQVAFSCTHAPLSTHAPLATCPLPLCHACIPPTMHAPPTVHMPLPHMPPLCHAYPLLPRIPPPPFATHAPSPCMPPFTVYTPCPVCHACPPPPNRITDRCKNITLTATSFAGMPVKIVINPGTLIPTVFWIADIPSGAPILFY